MLRAGAQGLFRNAIPKPSSVPVVLRRWCSPPSFDKNSFPRGFKNYYPKEKTEIPKVVPKVEAGPTPQPGPTPQRTSQQPRSQRSGGGDSTGSGLLPLMIGGGLLGGIVYYVIQEDPHNALPHHEIDFIEFRDKYLLAGEVKRLEVLADRTVVKIMLRDDAEKPRDTHGHEQQLYLTVGSVDTFEEKVEMALREKGVEALDFPAVVYHAQSTFMSNLMWSVGPTALILGLSFLLFRSVTKGIGGQTGMMFGFGKARVTKITKDANIGVSFADVAGLDEAKVEVMEFVKFLKAPKKFKDLGAKIPKGALLTGSPGTGKTLLAKAAAGEAQVPFLSISGSDFVEMFGGVGPSRVRDLFKQARKEAPCIVFIDEIDAIGRKRGAGPRSGGNDERENTLNQLLVEMDGFSTKGGVVVFAATNRADILDPALLRPGRFDRQIHIDVADINGRRDIFRVHLKRLKLAENMENVAQRLASLTPGFSGADIANVCNEAALIAARRDKDAIEIAEFDAAIDRVIGGLEKKNKALSPEERKTVAYHEAGHAVAGWYLEHANPLLKVSIVPRGSGALGFAQYHPKDQQLQTQNQMEDLMTVMLSGRAAEQIFFNRITTGAQDDLKRVTRMAYAQIVAFGMNDKLGTLSFPMPAEGEVFTDKPYSNATARLIDEEARTAIDRLYKRATELCAQHKDGIDKVAKRLLEREVLMREDLVDILGKRQWSELTTFKELGGVDAPPSPPTVAPGTPETKPATPPPPASTQPNPEGASA